MSWLSDIFLSKITIIVIDAAAIYLASLVWRDKTKNAENYIYLVMTALMLIWVNFAYLPRFLSYNNPELGLLLLKIAWFATPLFFYFLFLLTLFIIDKFKEYRVLNWSLLLLTLVSSFVTFFSSYIVDSIKFTKEIVAINYGSLMLPFLFAITIIIISTLYPPLKERTLADPKKKYLLIGIFIFYVANAVFNIALPIFMGIAKFYFLGDYSTIILLGFTAYAILRHELFSIKIVAAEVLTFTIWIGLLIVLFTAGDLRSQVLVGVILLLSIVFGFLLIRSVKKEIKQKEELHKLSKKLSRANKELKRLDQAKTEFLSIASHQLRTPLTVTKGFISLLAEDSYGKLNKEVKGVLNKVYTSNENLINLVEDLLNISRMESGRMKYEFADWDLEKMVKEISDILTEKARENGLYLKVNYPKKKLPVINMDGGKVREVITNFIDNAVKYTKKGGVTVDFRRVGENIRIIVSDTGIGIPKTELPFLFQKFSRGKDTKRLNATGTGLGLFVGRKIIEAHRGKVWAESKGDGKGSKFIIELPIDPPERREESREGEEKEKRLIKRKTEEVA